MIITYKDLEKKDMWEEDVDCFIDNFPNGLDIKDIEGKEVSTDNEELYDLYKLIVRKFRIPCTIRRESCYWEKSEYDKNGNKTYYEDSDGCWVKREFDENGNKTYHEGSDGYWVKKKYDENGYETYSEDSRGHWEKRELDENGKMKMGIRRTTGMVVAFWQENQL